MIVGLLLAAGAGRRFSDAPKQLADLGGRPLLAYALDILLAAPVDRRIVVLGARADQVRAALPLAGLDVVISADWEQGMGASLRDGLAAAARWGDAGAALVLLGDQPLITELAVERVLEAGRDGSVASARATYEGRPGHPVLLGRGLWDEITAGDVGARDVLRRHPPALVECGDVASDFDVDAPGDIAIARARLQERREPGAPNRG